MRPVEECLDIIFTKKGREWLKSFKLSDKQTARLVKRVAEDSPDEEESLPFNCGAGAVPTTNANTVAAALWRSIIVARKSYENRSLLIATFNSRQAAAKRAFLAAGYVMLGESVRNPNTDNLITAAALTLPPDYFKKDWDSSNFYDNPREEQFW